MFRQRTLEQLNMYDANHWVWPVTYRFLTSCPWGLTSQELSLDVPGCFNDGGASFGLGPNLWEAVIAPAISFLCVLEAWTAVNWKAPAATIPIPAPEKRGALFGYPTAQEDSGQWVLDTGHGDRYSKRRFFIPGMPRSWVDEGMLTRAGFEGLITAARAAKMGLDVVEPNTKSSWIIAYPNVVPASIENPFGVGFRNIKEVRVCQHVDKAPTGTYSVFPQLVP